MSAAEVPTEHPTIEDMRSGRVPVIASVSGGKDSTAMSLWLTEQGIEHRRVFADTGWEHPKTIEYVRDYLPNVLGPIDTVRGDLDFVGLVRKKGVFPRRMMRFCTQLLKVAPIAAYFNAHDPEIRAVQVTGIRALESLARSTLEPWEFQDTGITKIRRWMWRPLLRWTFDAVREIHSRHGVTPNPLYLTQGATRVGCYPCIFARKAEIASIARRDPWRIDEIRELESEMTSRRKDGARVTFFQAVKESHRVSGGGDGGTPIDQAVAWAKGNGEQLELFWEPAQDGCMRWGLCDSTGEIDAP